ncbi:MAG: SagB/ThcOx family dehydrogenase [Rhodospirillales bacterium]|jgi:SagB-type dehydrogenase family enzyme|nr:SagB/ThcOx family dehydrogenase [Rhodospirillales bacterium]
MKLPEPRKSGGMSLTQALNDRRSIRTYAETPLSLADVAQLLWSASGVTSPEGYRTTPSAGATFPLETYLVAGTVDGLAAGVYRYEPATHDLALTAPGDVRAELAAACMNQACVATCAAAILFGAVFERTTAKYGDMGRDFVLIEAGHAAQNVSLQAQALNLGAVAIGALDEQRLKPLAVMGENEKAIYMMVFGKPTP